MGAARPSSCPPTANSRAHKSAWRMIARSAALAAIPWVISAVRSNPRPVCVCQHRTRSCSASTAVGMSEGLLSIPRNSATGVASDATNPCGKWRAIACASGSQSAGCWSAPCSSRNSCWGSCGQAATTSPVAGSGSASGASLLCGVISAFAVRFGGPAIAQWPMDRGGVPVSVRVRPGGRRYRLARPAPRLAPGSDRDPVRP